VDYSAQLLAEQVLPDKAMQVVAVQNRMAVVAVVAARAHQAAPEQQAFAAMAARALHHQSGERLLITRAAQVDPPMALQQEEQGA
jgi:hypothetical protein